MSKTVIAYWLQPAPPARESLAQIIHQLAARFDAPAFEPHLTVLTAPGASRSPAEVLDELRSAAIELPVIGLGASGRFTKTLFVRMAKTEALQQLSDTLAKLSGTSKRKLADPHVSLLYKRLPERAKQDLIASISLPFEVITFRSLCAMRCASPTRTADDVRAWRLLATQNSKMR